MILASLKNLTNNIQQMLPQISEIEELINRSENQSVGRYETAWGYYMIQEGQTTDLKQGVFESHCKYLDIQCLLKGKEYLEWQEIDKLERCSEYSDVKDVQYLNGCGNILLIEPGMCYIMFPEDGHKACGHTIQKSSYRKFVAKIEI